VATFGGWAVAAQEVNRGGRGCPSRPGDETKVFLAFLWQ